MAIIDYGGQSFANVDEINGTPVADLGGGGGAGTAPSEYQSWFKAVYAYGIGEAA